MIVGTAGHIDHGKTTLVAALTGVDTDRLPEEKRRGISIELGYAYLDVPGTPAQPGLAGADGITVHSAAPLAQRIGFIDVPGHERLVHTMLAGATGIHLALLLVAADDGVMPQTREHLAVLSLLGLARGALVITKCDRADAARRAAVRAQATALVAGTPLAGAPVFEVAAAQGLGVAALKAWLFDQARAETSAAACALQGAPQDEKARGFRLAIDRAFTLHGVGTVVTGTVHAGRVAVGDVLTLTPGPAALRTRARSLHAQNQPVQTASAGQRCAVALVGVAKDGVARGQWLVAPALGVTSRRIDAQLRLWHAEARPLRTGTVVHVHLGAAAGVGRLTVLNDQHALAPGQTGLVQLLLDSPMAAWRGDRVVLRDAAAARTLAGGRVLDPAGPARQRQSAARLAWLHAAAAPDPQARLAQMLAASPQGLDLQQWARAEGRAAADVAALVSAASVTTAGPDAATGPAAASGPARLLSAGLVARVAGDPAWALSAEATAAACAATLAALGQRHRLAPSAVGALPAQLQRQALPRWPAPLWRALLAQMLAAGQITQQGPFLHLPHHGVQLSATEQRLAQKLALSLESAGLAGSLVKDLARDHQESAALVRTALLRLAREGALHQLLPDLFYTTTLLRQFVGVARQVSSQRGGDISAALFRDASGLGRRRAIVVLEYLDRIGVLRRVGDLHRLHRQVDLFDGTAAP